MEEGLKIQFNIKQNFSNRSVNNKNAFFIEGGGTKGIFAIGVIRYLFDDNPYINIKNINIFGGTSVGSFFATGLSLGFQRDEVFEFAEAINLDNLIDSKYMFMLTMYRFMANGYLYNNNGLSEIVQNILDYRINTINEHLNTGENKLSGKDLTFGHLKKLINLYPDIYKHLLINTVDISRKEQIFMTTMDDKWDDIKLFDAMMASSSVPYIFKPINLYYHPNSDKYGYEQTDDSTINSLIDGGISTNNPMDYFLINYKKCSDYNLWLLKFINSTKYVKIDGIIIFLEQLINYLLSKNDIKMDLIQEEYRINCINLHLKAGTLEFYTKEQIKDIIYNIYNQCSTGKLYFGN